MSIIIIEYNILAFIPSLGNILSQIYVQCHRAEMPVYLVMTHDLYITIHYRL